MKKFLLFLTLFLSAVGIANAEVPSITSTFTDEKGNVGTGELGWSASATPKGFESSNPARGLQFNGAKDFTLKSASSITNFKKISLVISTNGTTNTNKIKSIKVGEIEILTSEQGITKANNQPVEYSYSGETNISGIITISLSNTSSSVWIKSITVYYEGDTKTDPAITWTLDETALAEGAAVSAKLGETNVLPTLSFAKGATVTCKSSNEAVATVANDGTVEIHAAGTTTITASTPADDATFQQASKSYKLTVIDPSAPVYEIVFSEQGLTNNQNLSSHTFNSIGFVFDKGDHPNTGAAYNSSDNAIRVYYGNTITVTAPEGYYIAKIELTGSSIKNFGSTNTNGTFTISSTSFATWQLKDGETTSRSVVLKNTATSSNTVKFSKFVVYCAKDSNLKDAEFAFAETNVNKWVDDAAFTNTLTYAEGITDGIVYSIVNPEDVTVAKINSTTGEVTIKGVGTATITATRAEDATFKKGEASYTLVVSKHPHGLAYSPAGVSLEPGEELASQPTLKNDNGLTVSYSTSNDKVATVNEEGVIALAGATGQAVISATFAGNDIYEAGSATFTITVRKPVYADAIYTLVTNVNDIQAGDIVVIAASGKVMGNTKKADNRPAIAGNFSPDKTYLYGAADVLRLKVLKTADGFFMFQTENYAGTNGFLSSTKSTSDNLLKVLEETSDYTMATVTITEAGVATIRFNKGATPNTGGNRNNLRLNGNIFNCYGSISDYTAVSIYRATSHPVTIKTQVADEQPEFVESSVKLTNTVKLSEEATADKYAVLINGTQVGVFAKNSSDNVTVELTNAPYLPEAKYTICPVLAEDAEGNPTTLGHPEELTFTFPTLPTFDVTAMTPKWYYQESKFYKEAENTYADLDLWIYMTPSVTTTLSYTFAEFDNSVAGTEIWGWYDENKEQLQNCKYKFLTKVPVTDNIPVVSKELLSGKVATATFTPVFLFNVDSKYSSLISGSTRAAAPALLGEETPILVQEVNGTKISESIDVSELTGAEVSGVESVVVEGVDGAVEYYNMQGVRVEGELAPGMYIRRQGRSVSKVQIR